ncbi:uncharacterized protein PRD47_006533 isoform 1-T2 [Ara ararauna]
MARGEGASAPSPAGKGAPGAYNARPGPPRPRRRWRRLAYPRPLSPPLWKGLAGGWALGTGRAGGGGGGGREGAAACRKFHPERESWARRRGPAGPGQIPGNLRNGLSWPKNAILPGGVGILYEGDQEDQLISKNNPFIWLGKE